MLSTSVLNRNTMVARNPQNAPKRNLKKKTPLRNSARFTRIIYKTGRFQHVHCAHLSFGYAPLRSQCTQPVLDSQLNHVSIFQLFVAHAALVALAKDGVSIIGHLHAQPCRTSLNNHLPSQWSCARHGTYAVVWLVCSEQVSQHQT